MPPRKFKTITIKEEIYFKIRRICLLKSKELDRPYSVNDFLKDVLKEYEEKLEAAAL